MERFEKVARTHRALAIFYAGVALLTVVVFAGAGLRDPGALVGILVFAGVFVVVHAFTARAAYQKKEGARWVSMAIGILFLPGFPIGTLIGLYLIANTWSAWTTEPAPRAPPAERTAPRL